jgi:hypothetical protein
MRVIAQAEEKKFQGPSCNIQGNIKLQTSNFKKAPSSKLQRKDRFNAETVMAAEEQRMTKFLWVGNLRTR